MHSLCFLNLATTTLLVAILGYASASAADKASGPTQFRAYVGTYTGKKSQGIYTFTFNSATGEVGKPELAGEAVNPSFLAIHPSGKSLYAVGEVAAVDGKKGGGVSAFAIQPDGKLKLLSQASTVGSGPCHISVDKSGKVVLAANYGGGSVVALPIKADGSVGEHTGFVQHTIKGTAKRQNHAHSVNLSPDNRFAFVADLGLDQVLIYKLDAAKGTLTPNEPAFGTVPPGSGPRHFAFHPSGKFAYVCNEMASSVTAMTYDSSKGEFKTLNTVTTLPKEHKGNSTAETVVHPNGKFVYVSNRGHNSIAIFAIDEKSGEVKAMGHQGEGINIPRNFNIDPTGKWMIVGNQAGNSIVVFEVDAKTGQLKTTDQKAEVPAPICVRFVPKS